MATYTSTATGLWSAGATWVGGVKPPSAAGHKIIIAAGHTVTYDEAAGEYGDDTSSATVANNGIVVYGVLAFPTTVSTQLTCRGSLICAPGGKIDVNTTNPSVLTTIIINYSVATVIGKHILGSYNQTSADYRLRGAPRTRRARLTAPVTAGSSPTIQVDAAAGWSVGDELVFASDTDNPNRAEILTIASGSGLTWTLSGVLAYSRPTGCRVGNFSSNVTIKSSDPTKPGNVALGVAKTGSLTIDVDNVRFENIGSQSGWVGIAAAPVAFGVSVTAGASAARRAVTNVAAIHTSAMASAASACLFAVANPGAYAHGFDDCVAYSAHANAAGVYLGNDTLAEVNRLSIFRSDSAVTSAFNTGASSATVNASDMWSSSQDINATAGRVEVYDSEVRSAGPLANTSFGTAAFHNCTLSGTRLLTQSALNAPNGAAATGCTLSTGLLTGSNTTGSAPTKNQRFALTVVNGDAADNRVLSYWQTTVTDTTTRKRSTYSVKLQPKVANTAITYTFTIPAVSGVAQTIKGSLRFDATYGTATPPSIALSGQGVTSSFTAPATADAWHDFTLSFTPTSTGDITATVTVQSTSTSGFAWLDGVYHYPMTQSVRHYGYQWLPKAAQDVDTRITLTEAAALALPIVVDHGAETITITGSATAREVFEACIADLCQTANQGEGVHISSATGDTFSTTYTVIGTVVGPYTDAAGLHVTITASWLASGTRVRLYDVTNAVELYNAVLSGAGLSFATTWTADATIELRHDHDDYRAGTLTGILTSAGLTFLGSQDADPVATESGLSPAALTEFVFDATGIQVEIADGDNYTEWLRMYVAWQHYQTTEEGVASDLFGRYTSVDGRTYNLRVSGMLTPLTIRNNNLSAGLTIGGGYVVPDVGQMTDYLDYTGGPIWPSFEYVFTAQGAAAITVPEGERVITMASTGAHYARG